jgi:hypothetical protein
MNIILIEIYRKQNPATSVGSVQGGQEELNLANRVVGLEIYKVLTDGTIMVGREDELILNWICRY